MASVRWNLPSSFTCFYVGGEGTLTLAPGINIGIAEDELAAFVKHPIVISHMEAGILQVLTSDPRSTSQLEGFDVVDDHSTGQPMPVQPASKTAKTIKGKAVTENLNKLKAEADPADA